MRRSGSEYIRSGGQKLFVASGIALSTFALWREAFFDHSNAEALTLLHNERKNTLTTVEVIEKAQELKNSNGKESVRERSVWAIIISLLRTEFPSVLGALFSAVLSSGLGLALPWSAGQFIDIIRDAKEVEELFLPALLLAGLGVMQGLAGCFYYWLVSRTGERLAHALRTELFASIVCQDMVGADPSRPSLSRCASLLSRSLRALSNLSLSLCPCVELCSLSSHPSPHTVFPLARSLP